MKRLGVNIDHVATIRNARGESHPNPINAAKFIKKRTYQKVFHQLGFQLLEVDLLSETSGRKY